MAFGCDPVATSAVLRSPGPVVSINNELLPADDLLTFEPVAQLRCTLAAGSADQIAHFNALAMTTNESAKENQSAREEAKKSTAVEEKDKVNDTWVNLAITEIDQLYAPLEELSEVDIFVSYQFPTILGIRGGEASKPNIKTFKTPMRPYRDEKTAILFGNDAVVKHDLSTTTPQSILADLVRNFSHLSATSSTMGVDFQIIARLYKPVVRDIVIGVANLSLTRLASLITSSLQAQHRQNIYVRLPVTPNGQSHPIGWLTVRLDCHGRHFTESSKKLAIAEKAADGDFPLRVRVKSACGLKSLLNFLGIRNSSSRGVKVYCGLVSNSCLQVKSECEVADRSFCPSFRLSKFDISLGKHRQNQFENMKLQLFSRDKHQGDSMLGHCEIPKQVLEIFTKYRPKVSLALKLPLFTPDNEYLTSEDLLMKKCCGICDVEIQCFPPNNLPPVLVPDWFHCDPKSKIVIALERIAIALPVEKMNESHFDEEISCRLSIADFFSSPLKLAVQRPLSTVFNNHDVVIVCNYKEATIIEHAIASPPLNELVDFLAKQSAKIEVIYNGEAYVSYIPLIHLLNKPKVIGQYVLTETEPSSEYFGSSVFCKLSVEPLSGSKRDAKLLVGKRNVDEKQSFVATVGVSRALHLPLEQLDDQIYVVVAASEPIRTHNVVSEERPVWNFQTDCLLPRELLSNSNQGLIFRLMSTRNGAHEKDDTVIGYASVELASLSRGIGQVSGWYHLIDAFGHCLGQILVSIQPLEGEIEEPPGKGSALVLPFTNYDEVPTVVEKRPVDVSLGVDVEQLKNLTQRISQLLSDPLPPPFVPEVSRTPQPIDNEHRGAEAPVIVTQDVATEFVSPMKDVSTGPVVRELKDASMFTELNLRDIACDAEPIERKEIGTEPRKSILVDKQTSDSESSNVDVMFEVDKMLKEQQQLQQADDSSASNSKIDVVAAVDQDLFGDKKCFNLSAADSESRTPRAMSPSVFQTEEMKEDEEEGTELSTEESTSTPPPSLEAASGVSTEEWSQSGDGFRDDRLGIIEGNFSRVSEKQQCYFVYFLFG